MPSFFAVLCAATLAFAPEPLATCQLRTAPWYGPSTMMVRGLTLWADARGVRLERDDVTLPAVGQNPLANPGTLRCFVGQDVTARQVTPQGLHELDAAINRAWLALEPPQAMTDGDLTQRLHRAQESGEDALSLLALAVLRDDIKAVQAVWRKPWAKQEQDALVATAAAAGATQVLGRIAPLQADALNALSDAPTGNSPLHYAALAGQAEALKMLLAGGANPAVTNALGAQPLHDAARAGSAESIALLLHYGAQVAALTSFGDSVLHRAAMFGSSQNAPAYTATLHALLAPMGQAWRRSDVRDFLNVSNKDGFTALDLAVATGQDAMAQMLRKAGAQHGALWFTQPAARWNREAICHGAPRTL